MKKIERQWIDPPRVDIPPGMLEAAEGDTFLAAALLRRGIQTPADARSFLNPAAYTPTPPSELPDLELAASRILTAIQKGQPVGIWGDFDVDGQTATSLLVSSLKRLGAQTLFHIPVRATESHGVNVQGLHQLLQDGAQLILTCDTGVTAHEAVSFAREQGVDIIITDHHSLPSELPPAYAVVNPQRLPASHPLFSLCGVGCAYKLAEELHSRMGRLPELEPDLDLVALGTIADLADLKGDNRFLVWKGLQEIRRARRPALAAILEIANTRPETLTEEEVSFILSPRLNALGRLGDANPIVAFFLTPDIQKARVFATQLEGLNARRKLLCDQVFRGAQNQIKNNPAWLNHPVLVLNHAEWPAGVNGIVASRLVEQYHRPAILLSSPPGELARGSARSVEGINITEAIASTSRLLTGFGGHPMAAGLGLDPELIPEFRRELIQTIRTMIEKAPPKFQTIIDADIPLPSLSLDLIQSINRLSPFGPGNPPVVLAAHGVAVKGFHTIGRGHEHLKIVLEDENGANYSVLKWNGTDSPLPEGRFDLAFTARAAAFRGQSEVQITWVDERVLDYPARLEKPEKHKVLPIDLRAIQNTNEALRQLESYEDVLIWREGEDTQDFPGAGRHNLSPCTTLAFWHSPPGSQELVRILEITTPERVVFLDMDIPPDAPHIFLARLSGLVKHVISARKGKIALPELAGATGQREATLKLGLEWLAIKGWIQFSIVDNQLVITSSPGTTEPSRLPEIEHALAVLLKETAAFREYYRRTDPARLLISPAIETIRQKLGEDLR
ncbi:MAG: single-stranded-DNA-specific exonuclease RecJ [Anaerolineaceae bacterium]|nr:single-stranded-DNA-specific exonuclease RecJ [Anaerolineaceae bacterium]